MSRPLVVDAFPFHDELDILEMRLLELFDAVDWFVLVEATVSHTDQPKPLWYQEHRDRFAPFADKIIAVTADRLPTLDEDPDPWARELAQREYIGYGLARIQDLADADIILQSDVDEIPRALHARNVRPRAGMLSFAQRGHFWAVDWLHPDPWYGTVASRADVLHRMGPARFGNMRAMRNRVEHLPDAGWHFSWLGGPERWEKKLANFCHPEVEDRIRESIDSEAFYWREGFHCDNKRMRPVDVDATWPRWIVEGHAPTNWYRPRVEVAA